MIDWMQWREQFPVTQKYIYLNHAGIAPLSLRAQNAMRGFLSDIVAMFLACMSMIPAVAWRSL